MSMEFSNGNYTFISNFGKVANAETRKQMDTDGDGKISEQEKDLFYEEYYRTRKSELANFKSNNPDKELGFEFDMLDKNKDGFLDEEEQAFMDELLNMSDIANDFIKQNAQYKVGNFGGVVSEVKAFFEQWTNSGLNNTSNEDVSLSDAFKNALNETLSADALSRNHVETLTNSDQEAASVDLNRAIQTYQKDGLTDEEAANLEAKVSDSIMAKALQNGSAEDILANLLEGVTDANTKKQMVEIANKMIELVNSRYTVAADDFHKQLSEMADNIAKLVSGKGIAKAGTDNGNKSAEEIIENNTLQGTTIYSANIHKAMIELALNTTPRNEGYLSQLTDAIVSHYASQGMELDPNVVKGVLEAMPTDKDYHASRNLDELNQEFINTFNETLKAYAQNNSQHSVNSKDITLAYDENLQIKANPTEEDTDPFYIQKTTQAAAKGTINGIKAQVQNIAENAYIIKGLDLNQELFDKCFSEISETVMKDFDEEKISTMNEVLNTFVTQFNIKWASESTKDITEKLKEKEAAAQNQ